MTSIQFSLTNNNMNMEVNADDLNSAQANKLIALIQEETQKAESTVQASPPGISDALYKQTPKQQPRPSNVDPDGNNNIALMNKQQDQSQNTPKEEGYTATNYKEGYRLNDENQTEYKCRYRCPECGTESNRYLAELVDTVSCHHCKTDMDVHVAVINAAEFKPDYKMNWFVAGDKYPSYETENGRLYPYFPEDQEADLG